MVHKKIGQRNELWAAHRYNSYARICNPYYDTDGNVKKPASFLSVIPLRGVILDSIGRRTTDQQVYKNVEQTRATHSGL
jgi:hypothetical protein